MRLSIQDDLIEREEIVGREEEVHVFECLGLHDVLVKQFNSSEDVGTKGKRNLQARNSPCCLATEEVPSSHHRY